MFQLQLPEVLLDYYLSMVDPSRAQTVDTDIMCHCAHCLPAVLFTLGRHHWPYLSQLFHTLASSLQVTSPTFSLSCMVVSLKRVLRTHHGLLTL